jgi:hypothetical protein
MNLTNLTLVDDEIEEDIANYRNHKSKLGLNKTDISDSSRQTSTQVGGTHLTPNLKGKVFSCTKEY